MRGYSSERDTDTTRDYNTKQREKSNSKEKKRAQLPIRETEQRRKLKHRVLDLPKQMISHKYTPMSKEEKQKVKKLFLRKSNDPAGHRKHSPQLTGRNMMMANLSQEVAKLKLQ